MTAPGDRDDDPEGDPQLRQLRAVWISMRDEEPSDRGLAALMAAARDKAGTMKPSESWWQRVFAALRRPPVLALATVTVLIGGALALTRHGDTMKADPAVTADEAAPRAAVEHAGAPPPPVLPETARAPVADPEPPSAPVPVAPVQRPAHRKHGGPVAKLPTRPPVVEQAVRRDRSGATSGLAIATDHDLEQSLPAKGGTAKPAPMADEPTPDRVGSVQDGRRASSAPTIAQLVKQCETAAARGDCRAVRSLAAQIANADPGAYKAQIAKNSALARCLE